MPACRFRNQGDPILERLEPAGRRCATAARSIDLLGALNRRRLEIDGDPEIATRIASYEMAFRLQTSAPELMDLEARARRPWSSTAADPGEAVIRPRLPAGPPHDRARRALREHLPRGLGRAFGRQRQPQGQLR